MVGVASPQPNELEQKKKRQTLERAKANHLSKQLQMRLQYAKLKVEHGWQRQNLNEVENLYFHHSHLRSVRQGHSTGAVVVAVTNPGPTPESFSTPSGVTDQPVPSSDGPESVSPPSEETTGADGQSSSDPTLQMPVLVALGSSTTTPSSVNRPPSALDLADPHILARLAQLQAQMQIPLQLQSAPRQPSSTISPTPTSHPVLSPFPSYIPPPQPAVGVPFSAYPPQSFICTPTSASVPLYPAPIPSASTPHGPSVTASPSLAPTTTSSATPIPPVQTSIAPAALTYDSFWSTHASSTGPTRALYRTQTGFTASATPAGNVAMLTPGGNAAVMTADGVYVGGATSRTG